MSVILRASACACALTLLTAGAPAQAARPQTPTPAPGDAVIAAPGTPVQSLDGLSIARDGTGGLVYLADAGGVAHVFVSVLAGGAFQPPAQIDSGLAGASSQPVIAAGNGGVLLVAFINGGELYVCQTTSAGTPLSAPSPLFAGAVNPAISMSNFGKAYLAFTDTSGGGGEVRTAFWWQGGWGLEGDPLNADPADAAGLGHGRPAVIASDDGVGIVAWGENGHVYTRRVVKTTPSVVDEQVDPSAYGGWQEVSAADPSISAGGNDSFATVAFTETLSSGSSQQTVVLDGMLQGSQYSAVQEADGATVGGPEGAGDPQVAVNEYGRGLLTSALATSNELFTEIIGTADSIGPIQRVDSLPNSAPPYAVPAIAGLSSTLIAWQQTPGVAGPAEIRLRYAPDGSDLGPEQVLSSPSLGPTDAAQGLVAGGDVAGDAAVAWVQGDPGQEAIVASQLFKAPGAFVPEYRFMYSRTSSPTLSWTAANELWGSPQYSVSIDGASVGQTDGLTLIPPAPLLNGRHTYQVTAVNAAGVATAARPAVVFVDTVAPRVDYRLQGLRALGFAERLTVDYRDLPPAGLPPSAASGVATVFVRWGDGTVQRIRRNEISHVFLRARRYTITITVTDRAGNQTVKRIRVVIRRQLPKKRHHAGGRPHRRHARRGAHRRHARRRGAQLHRRHAHAARPRGRG